MELGTLLPLDCLNPGEWAEVADIIGESEWVNRMAELGVREGSRLKVLQRGSPCLLQVGNGQLCLRGDGGCQILVRLCG